MNRENTLKAVYMLQLVAAISMLLGLCLSWWESGSHHYTALRLFQRSLDLLEERSVSPLFQPTLALWLLWPVIIGSVLRGATGMIVPLVSFRRQIQVFWFFAMLVLIHFYISFGAEQRDVQPSAADGSIDIGYWLTCSSTILLGMLLLIEWILTPRVDKWQLKGTIKPITDDQLWSGEYRSCPYCGMLNNPKAKSCYNCRNLLFNFKDKDTQKGEKDAS
jgi:hypothetical protein